MVALEHGGVFRVIVAAIELAASAGSIGLRGHAI
jgi:hypothetical protein